MTPKTAIFILVLLCQPSLAPAVEIVNPQNEAQPSEHITIALFLYPEGAKVSGVETVFSYAQPISFVAGTDGLPACTSEAEGLTVAFTPDGCSGEFCTGIAVMQDYAE
ncbi:MAG: hypothetical protein ACRD3J_22220, partial [Thermoanaerobaculia bacterium]